MTSDGLRAYQVDGTLILSDDAGDPPSILHGDRWLMSTEPVEVRQ